MENQIIIGLVGQLATGKGTTAKYLKEKYNASVYGFSRPLRDILNRLYLPIERINLDDLSTILRQRFGQDILSHAITEDIKQDNNLIIVLDGIRRWTDIALARELPGFKLVKIITDEKLRYERLLKRGQNNDDVSKSFEKFQEDNISESNIQIPQVMEQADIEINNNGSIEELYKQIEKLYDRKIHCHRRH
ncbi:MAG: AAA family ATPase [bacterium]